ncbi:MAG: aspartate--tRNA ligase [Dehalococcoidia bacterium]|jgi:aspartyl-tRNA synthetase|nr:aspartate--tRNA ligase [Dehalococcoidia bacterium]MDW8008108.1 aspartate--tRNA ligase [Chloroflexota bacterium]
MLKTHACGSLGSQHVGQEVVLAGWVHRRRDHGGLIFVDLRDHDGIVQVVFHPREGPEAFRVADAVRSEYVLQVRGVVARRPAGTENPNLPTGEVEVRASEARVLNAARTPPFYVDDDSEVEELLRLKFRYLDLRRPRMHRNIVLRHRLAKAVRDFLSDRGFLEIETPVLTVPTPEGARDFLVPSRLHPGRFYALPQSPQQYKQILMVAGFERYFQLARCFRDEDLRADRQPEFTQLDLEWSFAEEEDILGLVEELMVSLVRHFRPDVNFPSPFPRLTYQESMERYGTDKPDLRYGLELHTFSDILAGTRFGVFKQVLAEGGEVRGLCLPGGAEASRRQIEEMTEVVKQLGAKGLVSFALAGEGDLDSLTPDDVRSPVARYFDVEEVRQMARRAGARRGDLLLLVADRPKVANRALDGLRRYLARRLGLADPRTFAFCFITDFPLLEWDEEDGRWYSVNHPFTAPKAEDLPLLEREPGRVRARAYDIVCNGWELGGGSIRIHERELQERVFRLLGLGPEEARAAFGHMLDAFEFGAPPHGGIALGFDRVVALFCGEDDIREVMAFPKTKSATEPMTGAPGPVTEDQLRELHLRLREE